MPESKFSNIPPEPDLSAEGEFRLLADSMPNLAWIAHPDGSVFWYNRRFYEYTGLTFEEMQGWGWQAVHEPQTLPGVLTVWHECLRRGIQFEMVFPLRGADGSFRPFLTRATPVLDQRGSVLRWFGTSTDISQQQATLAALRQSEQRFRTAAEAVSGLLWTNDPNGRMVGEQPAWAAFTGQTFETYQGYGWSEAVHPDDVQPTLDAWQESVRQGKLFSVEHRLRRNDGVFRLFRVRALPSREPNGSIREWVGVHTDITDERTAQQTLRETIAQLRRQEELVEAAQFSNNVGFWRFTPTTGELYLSAGSLRLHGFPVTSNPSLAESLERIHPDDQGGISQAIEEAMRTGQYVHEFRMVPGDNGEIRWIRGMARVLHSPGQPPYLVGLNLDVTEQKLASEALSRTEKLAIAGRLAASIAHEINNPLEAVTNLLFLLSETELTAEQRSYCDTITTEIERVSSMATHTLRFHRQSTRPGPTLIEALVNSVLVLFEGRIRSLGIQIARRQIDCAQVFGFDGEIRQVIANLVGNAIDALSCMPEPRIVTIRTGNTRDPRTGAPGITMLIADNGPGIPASAQARIFDPFFTTKGDLGTGLGLWVTTDIVRKHRGSIRLRSCQRADVHGAAFRIFLPHNVEPDPAADLPVAPI